MAYFLHYSINGLIIFNSTNKYIESRLFIVKILLVDDDTGSLRGMELALMMLNHSCDPYSDPCEAVKIYPKHLYDLVITDIGMPNINGFELEREIRSINADAKIIFISGNSLQTTDSKLSTDTENFFYENQLNFVN